MARRSRSLTGVAVSAALVTVALLGGVLAATPALGLEEDKVVFHAREGETFSQEYGPIPGQDTIGLFHSPGDCATAASCVEIPWEVVVPDDFDPLYDEFNLHVTLSWDDQDPTGIQQANDLDMYIYDVSDEENTQQVQSAATAAQPENAKVFTPSRGAYAILVSNFAGINTGFKIEMSYEGFAIEDPFFPREEPPPPAVSSDEGTTSTPTTAPPARIEASIAEATPVPVGPSVAAPALADGDGFGSFGTFTDVEEELAAPAEVDLLRRAAERRPAPPVPAAILVLWLALVPFALLGGALAFLIRRRPAALSVTAG